MELLQTDAEFINGGLALLEFKPQLFICFRKRILPFFNDGKCGVKICVGQKALQIRISQCLVNRDEEGLVYISRIAVDNYRQRPNFGINNCLGEGANFFINKRYLLAKFILNLTCLFFFSIRRNTQIQGGQRRKNEKQMRFSSPIGADKDSCTTLRLGIVIIRTQKSAQNMYRLLRRYVTANFANFI